MTFRKLLKWTIADALDEVWSKSGVTPSKKTRKDIIKAAEKISHDIDDDFISANKEHMLITKRWEDLVTLKDRRKRLLSDGAAANELIEFWSQPDTNTEMKIP